MRFPGVLVDIEERRRTEDALLKSNTLLRTFMEAVPGVIYAKDREGRLLVGNAGTARLLGRSYDEFVGRTDVELLGDQPEADAVMANDRRIMETGLAEQIEEQVTFPDGSTAWWLSTKAPLRNVADSRIVKLRWAETGGPAVVEPARRGFGSRMIEPALAAETGGRVSLHYLPTGVVCDVEAPVAD